MKNDILFLTLETFRQTGGIQQVCRTLAKALQEVGREVKLYSLCDNTEDLRDEYLSKSGFKAFSGNKLRFAVQTLRIAGNYPVIILSHVNLLPLAYVAKLRKPSVRIIMLAHGIEVWRQLSAIQRCFINKQTEIWAVSEFTKSRMIRTNKISATKIRVLNNGLDPYFRTPAGFDKPVRLLTRYKISGDQPVILSVCRLSAFEHQKGYDRVIKAIPELVRLQPSLRYLIAGPCDRTEKQRLEALIEDLNVTQHVHLLGKIKQEELVAHYLLADVFALPSQKEGFGLVLTEAAACGCKVIAGNRDGSSDALLGGRIGCLVDPNHPEQLTTSLKSCLSDLSRAHCRQLQQLTLKAFSFSAYKNKVKKLLL